MWEREYLYLLSPLSPALSTSQWLSLIFISFSFSFRVFSLPLSLCEWLLSLFVYLLHWNYSIWVEHFAFTNHFPSILHFIASFTLQVRCAFPRSQFVKQTVHKIRENIRGKINKYFVYKISCVCVIVLRARAFLFLVCRINYEICFVCPANT